MRFSRLFLAAGFAAPGQAKAAASGFFDAGGFGIEF
jgi:hypothetical protein